MAVHGGAVTVALAVATLVVCFSSLALSQPLASTSLFGSPVLLPYGSCSTNGSWKPQKQTLSFVFSHLARNKHHSSSFLGHQVAGSNSSSSHLSYSLDSGNIDDTLVLKLLESDSEKSDHTSLWFNSCNQSLLAFFGYIDPADTTVSSIAVHKVQAMVSIFPLLPIPSELSLLYSTEVERATDAMVTGYRYYVPNRRQDLSVGVASFVLYAVMNETLVSATVRSEVDLIALKNGAELLNFTANQETLLTLRQFDVIWFEPSVQSCNATVELSGTVVQSTGPIAVFTGSGACNETGPFSYEAHATSQLPPVHKWGTQFLLDFAHLDFLPTQDVNITTVFRIASDSANNTAMLNWYRGATVVSSTLLALSSGGWLLVEQEHKALTHVFIRASAPILVLYEVTLGNEISDVLFSMMPQPVEWFTHQQSIILIGQLLSENNTIVDNSNTSFMVTLSINSSNFDPHELQATQRDSRGNTFIRSLDDLRVTEIEGYTVSTFNITASSIEGDTLLLVSHTDPCAKLGASGFSYNTITGYSVHTNSYVLDDSSLTEGVHCTSPDLTTYLIIGGCLGGSVLVVTTALATLLVCCFCQRCLPCSLPDPPSDGFEYDVFLSFADESYEFAKQCLKAPLEKQGFSVFWPQDDYIVGLPLNDNVTRAIKISKVVVYILEESFHQSEECQKALSCGLHSHYKEYKGKFRRLIPLVVTGGSCPEKLKAFRAVKVAESNLTPQEIRKLIKTLKLGRPLSEYKLQRKGRQRFDQEDEDTMELLDPHVV